MKDNKKERILTAAAEIFSQLGFHSAKITNIAEAAGIGAGSVYLYFKNKEGILEELFLISWEKIHKTINEISACKGSADKKISSIIEKILDLVAGNPRLARLYLNEHLFWNSGKSENLQTYITETQEGIARIVREGQTSGTFNDAIDAEMAALYIIGGLWRLLAELIELGKLESDRKETLDLILALTLRGIQKRGR